jgi:hypothetical protein
MDWSYIAGPGEMSIPFLVDEKPTIVPGGDREARKCPMRAQGT